MHPITLTPLPFFSGRPGPLLLIIMDGIGLAPPIESNAIHLSKMPFLKKNMAQSSLFTSLKAHGKAVGMPSDDDMGNSEVGHNTLGAGRIFEQGAALVEKAIHTGSLFGSTWQNLLTNVSKNNSTLHFIGLLSDGNVHAHIRHLLAMIDAAAKADISKIRIHILLDGRDVAEKSALLYINQLESALTTYQVEGKDYLIASGGGRMITTMDRYQADWSIVKRGWDAHVHGIGRLFVTAREAVETMYAEDGHITDQHLPAFVIERQGVPVGKIQDNDSVILTNFRGDRAIELAMAFEQTVFTHFDRIYAPKVEFAGMLQYDGDLCIPSQFLVSPPKIDRPIGHYFCAQGIRSFAISETQKYGHVTYFWNGNASGYIDPSLETYVEISSDKISFDQAPLMKAKEITEKTIQLLESGQYKFGRINFPNGDMVGHTGVLSATIQACEITDHCVQQLAETVNRLNGITVVLSDHGNAEEMYTIKNNIKGPKTSHTLNPVPFFIVDSAYNNEYSLSHPADEGLSNVAATLCHLLGYFPPSNYRPSLIKF